MLGLSVGTSTLAAVAAGRVRTGPPVITRGGTPIDDFVHRIGDPVGIVAADGTLHSGADLLAQALDDLARAAANPGYPIAGEVAVAYPAYWRAAAVEALRRALAGIPAWAAGAHLVPDAVAALTALLTDPGLPARGVVVVCDFGAGGTTITLVDAGDGLRIIGDPIRHQEFSGDLVDRLLMMHVLAGAGMTPGAVPSGAGVEPGTAGTFAIGALTRLRAECRAAKQRLSTQTDTAIAGEPAGLPGSIRFTRQELDEILREPLAGMVAEVQNSLQRNGITPAELVAVASVGGMAAIPAITATLSEHLRVPIITTGQPGLSAAAGAALHAVRRTVDAGPTAITPAPARPEPQRPAPEQSAVSAQAWSQAADVPELVPQRSTRSPAHPVPLLDFISEGPETPESAAGDATSMPWYRKPLMVAAAVLAVIAGAGGATALALRAEPAAATSTPSTGVTQAPGRPSSGNQPSRAPLTVIATPGPAPADPAVPGAAGSAVNAPAATQVVSVPAAPAQPAPTGTPAPVAEVAASSPEAPPPSAAPAPQDAPAPSAEAAVTHAATPTPAAEPAAAEPPVADTPAAQAPASSSAPVIPAIPGIPPIPTIPAIPSIPIPSISGLPTLFPLPPSS